ncbi:hypothetical protein [Serratia fonticola]|uniref:hypothetical protein n=1 Tax=Serratia fonticola TaxID=47917 RepID=UPI003AAAA058
MGIYNMMDDFRFLYPKKSEIHKNIRPDRQHLNGLSNTYCLFWNDDERKRAVNIIQEINYFYDGLIDGEVIFSGECSSEYKDDLLVAMRQCVYKKMAMFSRLINYHHEVLRKYPKAGHLCFSLDVEKNIGSFEGYAAHDEIMKIMTKKLFNNLKSLALFSHVAAFFWVLLRRRDGYPYLHFNIYFKEQAFNHTIGTSINKTWFNIIKKQKRQGSIRYFLINNDFIGPRLSKGGIAGDGCLFETSTHGDISKKELFIYNDYNGMDMFSFCDINSIDKKAFELYLFSLSKLSFVLPGKSKSLGLSKIKR